MEAEYSIIPIDFTFHLKFNKLSESFCILKKILLLMICPTPHTWTCWLLHRNIRAELPLDYLGDVFLFQTATCSEYVIEMARCDH